MNRNRVFISLTVLVLIGLIIYLWPKTEQVPISTPPAAQSFPPPESQKKTELSKEWFPASVAPGSAQQASKPDGEASLMELFMTPIQFYGKVIDEKGHPVAGATAKMSVADKPITDGTKYTRISDGEGLFSLTGLHGGAVSVNVTKEGYYSSAQSQGMIRFGKFRSDSDPQIPRASSPTVFVLRKMGEAVPLIQITERAVRVPKNGTPVEVNLETGLTMAADHGGLKVECWTEDQTKDAQGQYAWRCRLSVPGGGLIERTGEYDFEAPSEGYKAYVELGPSNQKWSSRAEQQYFVRLPDNRYARIDFRIRTRGEHFFVIESYLNPTPGSRSLEYDPAKTVPSP